MKLYEAIVQNARILEKSSSLPILEMAQERQERIRKKLPSGSGFNNGSALVGEISDSKFYIETAFHHMDADGYYCGWSEHKITITASLMFGFNIKISGKDKNGIKEYMHDIFNSVLSEDFQF